MTDAGYGKTHVRKPPKPIVKQIEQQAPPAAAAALKTVATSSQFGAPPSTLHLALKGHVYAKHRGLVLVLVTAVMAAVGIRNR